MTAPRFYSPEAETSDMVMCKSGHEMTREVALTFGRLSSSRWACPYCRHPDPAQRQNVMQAYRQGVIDGRKTAAA